MLAFINKNVINKLAAQPAAAGDLAKAQRVNVGDAF